jgi:hypothetical protein
MKILCRFSKISFEIRMLGINGCQKNVPIRERFFDNRFGLYEITGRRGRSSKSPQMEISGSVRVCHATVKKIYDRR